MSAMIPFVPALTKIYPENGIPLAILLSIAAIALASTIALLVYKEAKESKEKNQKLLKGRKEQLLLAKGNSDVKTEDIFFNYSESEEYCMVGASMQRKINKAEIDLDIISNSFKSGELVNLESLKQKGLIDENTEYVKILAKGNLVKPLKIEANEFSNAAKNIVELSGGEVKKI